MSIAQLLKSKALRAAPLSRTRFSPLTAIMLALLVVAALGAGLFAAYAIFGPDGSDSVTTVPEWKPPTLAIGELDPPKLAAADVETLSRPIFSKSRRPSPKAAATPTAAEASEPVASPNGVVVSAIVKNKKMSQAFVVSMDTPQGAWKKVGETIDSWTISAINRADLILKIGEQKVKLRLYEEPQQ
jgi:hypothetical protein